MSAQIFTRNLSKHHSLRSKAAPDCTQPAVGVKLGCIIMIIILVWFYLVVKTLTRCPFQTLMVNELMSEGNQKRFWCLYLDHFKRSNNRDVNFQKWISRVRDKRFEFCFVLLSVLAAVRPLWALEGVCVLAAVCLRVWECSKTRPWDIGSHFWCYVNVENVSRD